MLYRVAAVRRDGARVFEKPQFKHIKNAQQHAKQLAQNYKGQELERFDVVLVLDKYEIEEED